MRASAGGRAALALTVASFGGAAFNYLFQVHAAAVLDAAAFGELSAWLAWVTLAGLVATVVQFVSLDHRLADAQWQLLVRGAGVVSFALVVGQLVLGARTPRVVLGGSAIAAGILLYAIVGQLQARLELGIMALSVMVSTGARFALPFAWARDAREPWFYVAHAGASFAAVAAVALVAARGGGGGGEREHERGREDAGASARWRLRRPILLAFATVLFPIVDVLVVSSTQDAVTTGAFSRLALAARVVFFSGTAALQILLPHQLRAATTGETPPWYVMQLQRWLTPAAIAGAAVLALLLDRVILRPQGAEQVWLWASCFSSALLVALLGHVNRFAARSELGLAAACVAGVVATRMVAAGLAGFAAHTPVTRYVLVAVAGDALVLVGAAAAQLRSRSARV